FAGEGWMTAPEYLIGPRGIHRARHAKGKMTYQLIAPGPINVSEVGIDEHGRYHCNVRYRYGSEEASKMLPRSAVAGNELLQLAAHGAPVTSENMSALVRFLQHQEIANRDRLPYVPVFTRCGWSPNFTSFVIGKHVVGAHCRAVVDADPRFLEGLSARGSEAECRRIVIEARDKSVIAELAWSAGYVAPLLRLLDMRGLVISFWGQSGYGKSAGQALAESVWGRPGDLRMTGDVTPTAVEAYFAMTRDLIAHLDDTQLSKSQELLDQLAYVAATGVGRGRGTQTGGLRPPATWLTVVFVSGEKPLLRAGAAAGYANRTLEVHAEPFEKSYAPTLHQALDQHHGHLGPQYVAALIERFSTPTQRAGLRAMFDAEIVAIDPNKSERAKQVALLVVGSSPSCRVRSLNSRGAAASTRTRFFTGCTRAVS
ncbi:MAG: DUF927 domain-containing protein, partial [Proteobacteria bacterium]|nr:DUF927 domain-containing protein [Pseudomonadota bacterium]